MKAKDVSLKSIVLAIVWVCVMSLCKAFVPVFFDGKQVGITMLEIFGTGAFFVIACSPVYRSIWLDKKLGIYEKDAAKDLKEPEAVTWNRWKEEYGCGKAVLL